MTTTLILLRHGESTWNALNQFTGWVDVPLSEKGTAEAIRGDLLTDAGVLPDVLHVPAPSGDHHGQPGAGRGRSAPSGLPPTTATKMRRCSPIPTPGSAPP